MLTHILILLLPLTALGIAAKNSAKSKIRQNGRPYPPPGTPYLENPCKSSPYQGFSFCNTQLSLDERASDAVSRLTQEEKFGALTGSFDPAPGSLPSLGLGAYIWQSEATHGISEVRNDPTTPYQSNFALPITTGCSFNRSLWYATGNQIGREARAFMNAGNAYSTFWAPVINIVREPRWGRNLETPGEDPFVSGQYAKYFVSGFQTAPEAPYMIQASACCKHFVANELDNWNGTDRDHMNAIVSPQDLQDSYLPPFQACVEQGRVSGIMCSYNSVNGIPSCANEWLLKTVLREDWMFDGYVVSDCDADADVFNTHNYTTTPEEAVRDVLRAGTDVDCGGFVQKYIQSALNKGVVTMDDIDTALKRMFRVRLRLGHFDVSPLDTIGLDTICSPYAKEIARDGARQGTVLLKNDHMFLPVNKTEVQRVAVIGPNANLSKSIALYYGGPPCGLIYYCLTDAVAQYIPQTTMVPGLPSVLSNDTSGFTDAIAAAKAADLVVLALGLDGTVEGEGDDRTSIDLPSGQKQLVAAITAAVTRPVVAVILTGGAVDLSSLLSNSMVGAILEAGQPSVTVLGVADLIFGEAVPAGRMVQTTYPADYVNQVSMFDMGMRPGPSNWPPFTNPGRTYRFYTGKPVLPFGFGLSYTTFTYVLLSGVSSDRVTLAKDLVTDKKALQAEAASYYINVTNTGKIAADDVVLGFLTPPGAGTNGVALQTLFGFERIHLKPGQSKVVYLGAQGQHFTHVLANGVRVSWPGRYGVHFGVHETLAHGMGYAEATTHVT